MDFVNKLTGGGDKNNDKVSDHQQQGQSSSSGGGFMDKISGMSSNQQQQGQSSSGGGGFMDKINGMAGGGAQGEKNEDALDKAVDFVQEKFLGQGDQSNESAAEQAKDEAISDFIRDKYKESTGKDFFIADKEKKYGL